MRLLTRVEADHHRHGWNQPCRLMVLYDDRDQETRDAYRRILAASPNHGAVPNTRVGHYVAQTLLPPAMLYGYRNTDAGRLAPIGAVADQPPWAVLRRFVVNIAYVPPDTLQTDVFAGETTDAQRIAPEEMLRAMLRLPGLLGYAMVAEVWLRRLTAHQWREEVTTDRPVDYAGQPDSKEARQVTCVDLCDRVHAVRRVRDARPDVAVTADGPRTALGPGGPAPHADTDTPIRGDISTSLRILADVSMGRTPPPELFDAWYPSLQDIVDSGREHDFLGRPDTGPDRGHG